MINSERFDQLMFGSFRLAPWVLVVLPDVAKYVLYLGEGDLVMAMLSRMA